MGSANTMSNEGKGGFVKEGDEIDYFDYKVEFQKLLVIASQAVEHPCMITMKIMEEAVKTYKEAGR